MQLDKELYNEIKEFCELNELKTRDYIHKLLKDAFMIEKYGNSPFCKKNADTTQNEKKTLEISITDKTPQIENKDIAFNSFIKSDITHEHEIKLQKEETEITYLTEKPKKEIKKKRKLK